MPKRKTKQRRYWFEKLVALIALINLLFVFFNLSYISLRDVYLQAAPELTQRYDPVKGISPHPETQYYLATVEQLRAQVAQTGLQSPEAEAILAELRLLSDRLIQDDPFAVANQSRALAKIKNQMRDRVNQGFAREAFNVFWSQPYLSQAGWQSEIEFFDLQLRPLLAANYYRDVNRFNRFVDHFWIIDLPFILFFALEIAARTLYLSRRRPDLTWTEAILRRWYDLFLLLPFWRWLRVLPVTIRLYQSQLIDLEPVRAQFSHDFVISFAQELMETMGVQVIDQLQETVSSGDASRLLFQPKSSATYVEVGNTNEVKAIATRLADVSIHDVLPQVRPDIEALMHHGIVNTLEQSPIYRQLKGLPGFNGFPSQLTDKLAEELSRNAYQALAGALEDPVAAKLSVQLADNFRHALVDELQKKHNLQQIEAWLVDLLEEVKINYVRRIAESDLEQIVEEAEQLERRNARISNVSGN